MRATDEAYATGLGLLGDLAFLVGSVLFLRGRYMTHTAALALEPSREDVMKRPPRPPSEPVITGDMIRRILIHGGLVAGTGLAAFGLANGPLGLDLGESRGVVFLAMSAGQTLAVFNARTDTGSGFVGARSNPWLWAALAVTAVLEVLALTVLPLRGLLGLELPPVTGLAVGVGLALLPLAVIQGWRWARSRDTAA